MNTTARPDTQETAPAVEATPRPWRAVFNKRLGHWVIHHHQPCAKGDTSTLFTIHTSLNDELDAANAAFVVQAINSYDGNREMIEQLQAKLHCCCGDTINHSAWVGHSPVSMYDHALDQANSRVRELEEAINLFLQPRMTAFHDSRAVDDDLVALAGVVTSDGIDVSMAYLREHADDVMVPLEVQITVGEPGPAK